MPVRYSAIFKLLFYNLGCLGYKYLLVFYDRNFKKRSNFLKLILIAFFKNTLISKQNCISH